MGVLIGVSHALDFAFNRGKGKIFDTWREKLLGEMPVAASSISKEGKKLMSKRFEEFLHTLPRKDS